MMRSINIAKQDWKQQRVLIIKKQTLCFFKSLNTVYSALTAHNDSINRQK